MLNKKEYGKLFFPYNERGKQIWVVTGIIQLPIEIVKMAIRLADLDFIKYVRIGDESLSASSENYPKRPKVPITHMNHETAIGIQILYHTEFKYIDFYDINSPVKGKGSRMVNAILKDFPEDWQPTVTMDWSNGFWEKMTEKYNQFNWD